MDLQKLPSDLEEFKNLQYLNLRHNKLTSIPPYIKNFSGLYALFLDDNPISKIPDEIIELRNLKVLTINGTEIKSLPNGFYNLNLRLFLVGGAPLNDLQFKEAKEKMKGTKIITSVD